MKNIIIGLIKLLCAIIKYLKTIITLKIAFLISAFKSNRSFDLSKDEEDINIITH